MFDSLVDHLQVVRIVAEQLKTIDNGQQKLKPLIGYFGERLKQFVVNFAFSPPADLRHTALPSHKPEVVNPVKQTKSVRAFVFLFFDGIEPLALKLSAGRLGCALTHERHLALRLCLRRLVY